MTMRIPIIVATQPLHRAVEQERTPLIAANPVFAYGQRVGRSVGLS
jgi:hypothetical protein